MWWEVKFLGDFTGKREKIYTNLIYYLIINTFISYGNNNKVYLEKNKCIIFAIIIQRIIVFTEKKGKKKNEMLF